jgi:oxalate decarboxylase
MARRREKNAGEFSRRDILSTAVAGGVLTAASASIAQTADQPNPSREPGVGGADPVPGDVTRERQNPDILNPPATDSGTTPNLRFSFADAHVRQSSGGWTRQVTARELGVSKSIAGVNMRLNAGGIRELHWHKQAEWAFMLYGGARITAIDAQGRNFVDDVGVGDLWYFPGGIPHSIQGLAPDGCEFLLVFDDGDFDEDSTFLLSDWFKHVPPEVLGKISRRRRRNSDIRPIRASCTSSRRRFRSRSVPTSCAAQSPSRRASATG